MSLAEYSAARLNDWNGPYYPDAITEVGRAFEAAQLWANIAHLGKIASHIAESYSIYGPSRLMTDDGYTWYAQLQLNMPSGSLLVLIPNAHPEEGRRDELFTLDRSPAVYTQLGVTQTDIDHVIKELIRLLPIKLPR